MNASCWSAVHSTVHANYIISVGVEYDYVEDECIVFVRIGGSYACLWEWAHYWPFCGCFMDKYLGEAYIGLIR